MTDTLVHRIESHIPYHDFYSQYIAKNKLCILSSKFTEQWRSRTEWTKNGKIDVEHLKHEFGNSHAPVVDCSKRFYTSHECCEMKVEEFLDYLDSNKGILTGNSGITRDSCLYLKDWHCQRDFPNYHAYTVPEYFTSDWLNEYWDQKEASKDDYRFVYIGAKDSWTPFHADVFRSFSWSANICGTKKWYIFPPGEENKLKDRFGKLPFNVVDALVDNSDIEPIVLFQREGEIIFVPSGWHHQVHNLEDTISINHNWVNAASIEYMWSHLKQTLLDVKEEISDCRDMDGWNEQCQLILLSTSGIDYNIFLDMLLTLLRPRLKVAKQFIELRKLNDNDRLDQDLLLSACKSFHKLKVQDTPSWTDAWKDFKECKVGISVDLIFEAINILRTDLMALQRVLCLYISDVDVNDILCAENADIVNNYLIQITSLLDDIK